MTDLPINGADVAPSVEPLLDGVPPEYHQMVRDYGRELFMLVNNGEYARGLFQLAGEKNAAIFRDSDLHLVLTQLAGVVNVLANEYALKCQLDPIQIHNARRDWAAVQRARIAVPASGGKIIISH